MLIPASTRSIADANALVLRTTLLAVPVDTDRLDDIGAASVWMPKNDSRITTAINRQIIRFPICKPPWF